MQCLLMVSILTTGDSLHSAVDIGLPVNADPPASLVDIVWQSNWQWGLLDLDVVFVTQYAKK